MDSSPLIEALVVGGSLAALVASILAIYMVLLSIRVYRLTLTTYNNMRDSILQMTIQLAERGEATPKTSERQAFEEEKPVQLHPETRAETPSSILELVSNLGLKSALLFDESGQVIEREGVVEASREAAVMAELISTLQLARSSISGLQIIHEDVEVIVPTAEVAGKKIYLYVRGPRDLERLDVETLAEDGRRILDNLLGGG